MVRRNPLRPVALATISRFIARYSSSRSGFTRIRTMLNAVIGSSLPKSATPHIVRQTRRSGALISQRRWQMIGTSVRTIEPHHAGPWSVFGGSDGFADGGTILVFVRVTDDQCIEIFSRCRRRPGARQRGQRRDPYHRSEVFGRPRPLGTAKGRAARRRSFHSVVRGPAA